MLKYDIHKTAAKAPTKTDSEIWCKIDICIIREMMMKWQSIIWRDSLAVTGVLYKLLILKGTIDICEMITSQFKLTEQFSKSKERRSQIANNIETLRALHL